ncbi:hypothetical protein B0H19DRAFT_1247260 [Mycena capillaripes]|nr:hypothetical protein B0H19DRAFT_1247260 [Mycena capillaripes]
MLLKRHWLSHKSAGARNWIEPLIYEHVSPQVSSNRAVFLSTVTAHPASFLAAHIKHLYQNVSLRAVRRVLKVCTGACPLISELTLPSTPADLSPWAASLTHLALSQALPPDFAPMLATLPASQTSQSTTQRRRPPGTACPP